MAHAKVPNTSGARLYILQYCEVYLAAIKVSTIMEIAFITRAMQKYASYQNHSYNISEHIFLEEAYFETLLPSGT